MYKALCVVALLVATFALTSGSKTADASPSGLPSPVIVAKAKLVNQTAPIPTTTIFTPTQNGLYRLSVYATLVKSDPTSQSSWNYNITWTDDSGITSGAVPLLDALGNSNPGIFFCGFTGTLAGPTMTLEAAAGTPITYSVTQQGAPDSSAYSLYYTLERLE